MYTLAQKMMQRRLLHNMKNVRGQDKTDRIKRYRKILLLLLLVAIVLGSWYFLSVYQKNRVRNDGILVREEVTGHEGKA